MPNPWASWTEPVAWMFLDVETTGLSIGKHGIIQMSGFIEATYHDPAEFNLFCRPQKGVELSDQILEWHGLSRAEVEAYPLPRDAYNQLRNLLREFVDPFNKRQKMHIVAYNAPFDTDFLRDFFKREGDKYFGSFFWHPPIDVMTLAAFRFQRRREHFQDFKLATVAKQLGLEVEKENLHDGLYDVRLTRDVYYALIEDMKRERQS